MPARQERWLPVPGWPAYEVSDRGRVRSVDRLLSDGRAAGGKVLSPAADAEGYLYVTLSAGPRRERRHVARLVLLAFSGPCPDGCEALHGNGRRTDNKLRNLRWGTKPENRADVERHRGERAERTRRGGRGTGETGPAAPGRWKVASAAAETGR